MTPEQRAAELVIGISARTTGSIDAARTAEEIAAAVREAEERGRAEERERCAEWARNTYAAAVFRLGDDSDAARMTGALLNGIVGVRVARQGEPAPTGEDVRRAIQEGKTQ